MISWLLNKLKKLFSKEPAMIEGRDYRTVMVDDSIVEFHILTGPDAGKVIRLMRYDKDDEDRNANTAELDHE